MKQSCYRIPAFGLDIAFDTIVSIPPSYMAVGDEVKAALRGVVLPKEESEKAYIFTGALQIWARFTCDKCLKEVEWNAQEDMVEEFSNDNPDAWPAEGDTIDFAEAVRANICALLPMKILCKDDCFGLCPACGKDLNRGTCDCEKPLDLRFAVLSSFFDKYSELT